MGHPNRCPTNPSPPPSLGRLSIATKRRVTHWLTVRLELTALCQGECKSPRRISPRRAGQRARSRNLGDVMLIERERTLETLTSLLEEARSGHGRVALIRGEAGIGKTSVIREFATDLKDSHVLWGACDDLMAARPLGPFWDMAHAEPELEESLRGGDRQATFATVLDLLARSLRPTMMVIDDVHWADDATLDLIKFVGRRIDRTHGLLALTYRDGEVAGDHPLRVALGDLPYGVVERISLAPLTEEGVVALAGDVGDVHALWEITGGNPFFVSEVAGAHAGQVPLSIRDAVNARVQRLSDDARALVELTSVAPSKIELVVVKDVLGDAADAIAECEEAGILELSGDALRFRHELARRAVEGDLPAITRRQLHLQCLEACERLAFDVSFCAHHALGAEDPDAIVRILPGAAQRASDIESHTEALASLRALEPYLDRMNATARADYHEKRAYEEYLAADQGLDYIQKAIEIRRDLDDAASLANSLLIASRIAWVGAQRSLALEYAEEAAALVDKVGGPDQAMSYSVLSQLAMLGGFNDEALSWAEKALALVGDEDSAVRAHALNNVGSVKMMDGSRSGMEELLESRRIAASLGLIHHETRACVNLAWNHLSAYRLDEAKQWIDAALAAVGDAEMPSFESYTYAEQAWWHEMRGEWDAAEAIASSILELGSSMKTSQGVSARLLSKISARRGSRGAEEYLGDALDTAERADEAQRLGPAYSVVAEYAWLGGQVEEALLQRAAEVMDWCYEHGSRAPAGEIGQWLFLLGKLDELPPLVPEPWLLLSRGDWAEAAEWWQERGLPYERAVALSRGDTGAKLDALRILDELGAVPLATRIRNQLQDAGVTGVPRGPQKATRGSPHGLTARQTDVLDLLSEGLTNAEIADRLFISTRTVDHHVSAILAKLGASTRAEAAEIARS